MSSSNDNEPASKEPASNAGEAATATTTTTAATTTGGVSNNDDNITVLTDFSAATVRMNNLSNTTRQPNNNDDSNEHPPPDLPTITYQNRYVFARSYFIQALQNENQTAITVGLEKYPNFHGMSGKEMATLFEKTISNQEQTTSQEVSQHQEELQPPSLCDLDEISGLFIFQQVLNKDPNAEIYLRQLIAHQHIHNYECEIRELLQNFERDIRGIHEMSGEQLANYIDEMKRSNPSRYALLQNNMTRPHQQQPESTTTAPSANQNVALESILAAATSVAASAQPLQLASRVGDSIASHTSSDNDGPNADDPMGKKED